MMGNWTDHQAVYVEMHMREMRDAAARAHQVRQARPARPLRRRVGGMLVAAGERIGR